MKLFVVGISHKTAPVSVRDKVALNPEELAMRLEELKENELVKECLLLSTCNRTELYGLIPKRCRKETGAVSIYKSLFPSQDIIQDENIFYYSGEEVVRHLFHVSSGLDSLAIGEPQIFGQLKDAYKAATKSRNTGPVLNRLIHITFSVTKSIRTQTGIGEGTISIGFAAVEMAQKIFRDLSPLKIMVIGAGETGTLTAGHFKKRGASKFLIANRTFEKAENLAANLNGSAVRFNLIDKHMSQVDIIVTCVGADDIIIKREPVEQAMKERRNRPLFFIDLGTPRDVEPGINSLYNVFSYNIDDLKDVVEANRAQRQSAVADAERIIEEYVKDFLEWYAGMGIIPTIKMLQDQFEKIRTEEIEANIKKRDGISREQVDLLTKSIVRKLLKSPILNLKENASSEIGMAQAEALRKMFDLKDGLSGDK